jgi:molybdopterin converting factor small subunit
MKIRLLAFGITRDILGNREVELEIDLPHQPEVGDLRRALLQTYPKLEQLRSLGIAVNNVYSQDSDSLDPTEEIALIPPVSGG